MGRKTNLQFKNINKLRITNDKPFRFDVFGDKKFLSAKKLGISPARARAFLKKQKQRSLLKKLDKQQARKILDEFITEKKYIAWEFQNISFANVLNFFRKTGRRGCIVKNKKGERAVRYWILRLFKNDIIAFEEGRKAKLCKRLALAVAGIVGTIFIIASIYVHFFSTTRTVYVFDDNYHRHSKYKVRWHKELGWRIDLGDTMQQLQLDLYALPTPKFLFQHQGKTYYIPAKIPVGQSQIVKECALEHLPIEARSLYRGEVAQMGCDSLVGVRERVVVEVDWQKFSATMTRQFFSYDEKLATPFNNKPVTLRFARAFWFCDSERFTVSQAKSWPQPLKRRKWGS